MWHDLSLSTQLRTGIGSGDSPVCGDITPELYAPEVEQTTHEVSLTQHLVTGRLLTCPVESVNTIDDGTGTGNTYVNLLPDIVIKSFLIGHQVTNGM